ncbi:hypothetical protein CEXT_622961 [Caerostris extrusa]|uniref:Uncharacterized protein n=1 Tax=Caerostris extrusa TaxID=172846 RepID=A0AAV4XUK2_CAEEX|nr:hypothetical protein CEXT_622961 [Caerostris extrusa]
MASRFKCGKQGAPFLPQSFESKLFISEAKSLNSIPTPARNNSSVLTGIDSNTRKAFRCTGSQGNIWHVLGKLCRNLPNSVQGMHSR